MARRGPKTKLDQDILEVLAESVSAGCSYRLAAIRAGVDPSTLSRWLRAAQPNRRLRELRNTLKKARADAEYRALKAIHAAGADPRYWTASAWFLQHVIRGKYLQSAKDVARGGDWLAAVPRDRGTHANGRPHGRIASQEGDPGTERQ
jgi:hypothetical protein